MPSLARAVYVAVSLGVLVPAAACGSGPLHQANPGASTWLGGHPASGWGKSFAGAYLAGRHAERQFDLGAAADHLDRALAITPDNVELRQRVFLLKLSDGRFDESLADAERLAGAQDGLTLSALRVALDKLHEGEFAEARALVETIPQIRYNAAMRPALLAWIALAEGDADAATALLDTDDQRGSARLTALHKALINDVAGRPEAARDAFAELLGGDGEPSLRVVQLASNFLDRHGESDRADELRDGYRSAHPQSATLMPGALKGGALKGGATDAAGEPPEPLVRDARDGIAEILFNLAGIYYDDRELAMALVHARLAEGVRPGNVMSTLLIGEILELQKRYADALALYREVGGDTAFDAALKLRIARNLDRQERTDEAIHELESFVAGREAGSVDALLTLGHILRGRDRFDEAARAYDRAVDLVGTLEPRHWGLVYARGIALERSGEWERAQADLKKALELSPDQPFVLNYLGYSWIDRGDNLKEAERLVRRAVELRPDDGFIADSLGWVFYVTGRYAEAVRELERAIELEPGDPTINEHLGDAYWKVGRRNEARFQWSHALRMDPDDKRVANIRSKVRCGLEGCPIKAAQGGG